MYKKMVSMQVVSMLDDVDICGQDIVKCPALCQDLITNFQVCQVFIFFVLSPYSFPLVS